MKINCDVIRDLLPLYAENMVSEDSGKIVEDHLRGCSSCVKVLNELREPVADITTEIHGMELVKKSIRKRRNLAVGTAVLLIVSILLSVFVYLAVPVLLTAEEAIESVTALEDGRIKVQYTESVDGKLNWGHGRGYRVLLCYSVRLRKLLPRDLPEGMNDASYNNYDIEGLEYSGDKIVYRPSDDDWWYLNCQNGMPETLLHDAEECTILPENIEIYEHLVDRRPVMVFFMIGALVAAVLALCLRKLGAARYFGYAAMWLGGHGVAILLVTSGRMLEVGQIMRHLLYIPVLGVLYFSAGLVAFELWKTREDV